MKYTAAIILAAAAALVSAQDFPESDPQDEYLTEVCLPTNSTGYPDFNAPCNAVLAIEYQCAFGPEEGLKFINASYSANETTFDDEDLPKMQDNSTQRACICESQFFNEMNGCLDCYSKHGDQADGVTPSFVASVSSAYCAASYTPTVGFADYFANVSTPTDTASGASSATATSSFSDPIGNKTAVSLYYTGSVTGTAAWQIPTTTGSTTKTSNGQLGPTASGNAGNAASTTTGKSGAQKTQAAAVAGVVGLAGFIALL